MLRDDPPVLRAQKCKVFKKELVYFYAAKPAYRLKRGDEPTDLQAHFPCAIILDPMKINAPHHIFPFDTGAALDGNFDHGYSDGTYIEDFSLGTNFANVNKLIGWAFGNLNNYYEGRPKINLHTEIPNFDFVTHSYIRIISRAAPGHATHDLRASAVEVAYDCPIHLADAVKFLIVPDAFLENRGEVNKDIQGIISKRDLRCLTYPWLPGERPNKYIQNISDLIWNETAGGKNV